MLLDKPFLFPSISTVAVGFLAYAFDYCGEDDDVYSHCMYDSIFCIPIYCAHHIRKLFSTFEKTSWIDINNVKCDSDLILLYTFDEVEDIWHQRNRDIRAWQILRADILSCHEIFEEDCPFVLYRRLLSQRELNISIFCGCSDICRASAT